MLQFSQCRLHYKKDSALHLWKKVAGTLHIHMEDMGKRKILRRTIDARKKPEIMIVYTVAFEAAHEERILKRNSGNKNLSVYREEPDIRAGALAYRQQRGAAAERPEPRIVVVGAGPAGLFSAYYLALCGFAPVVVERGGAMEERMADVQKFWDGGTLNAESNVSFGEGGAGTFSDGKLNTGVKDRTGCRRFVLESFVRFGAKKEILYDAKPHIGTDVLRKVIVTMRREMESLGCRFLFHTKFTALVTGGENRVTGICVEEKSMGEGNGAMREIPCDALVLAVGHSARDTVGMLFGSGVEMSKKAFAIGVRIQHSQKRIDKIQYGSEDTGLPPADYKVTAKAEDGRGVYSFCMCPGGYVVNASTEEGGLAVNGMSDAGRGSGAANSAIVVSVGPEDFGGGSPLAGIDFQRKWEREMYRLAQGKIPVQRLCDFKEDRETAEPEKMGCGTTEPDVEGQRAEPCVKGRWAFANLRRALPKFVLNDIIEGIGRFDRKMPGFDDDGAWVMGIETRTSSPVRIGRGGDFVSVSHGNLYPCGEGAGYAGGIMSAAMDGLRVAMAIQESVQSGRQGRST